MSNGQPPRRSERARSALSRRRTSMDSMKTEFRNRFLERLRASRSKSVDRLRLIVEHCDDKPQYQSLSELRRVLMADTNNVELMSSDEEADLLKEVEEELRQVSLEYEADKYDKQTQQEAEDAVNRLMVACQVCQNFSIVNICPKCNAEINSTFV